MLLCTTLRSVQLAYVKFDPTNAAHLEAFQTLCLGQRTPTGFHIKQHPVLRFELEDGFPDIRSMMFHKVGQHHMSHHVSN